MHNPRPRIVQTFLLIWLDSNIDESKDDYKNSIAKLQQIVNDINIFTDPDECIQFLANINEEKAFIIISGALGERVTPTIHEMRQIDAIFIFCGNKSRHEKWAKHWPKIKGVFTDTNSMCECIKQAAQEVCQDAITISFVKTSDTTSKQKLDQLDSSYMYTQILKAILLEIDFENVHFQDFIKYCSEILADNSTEMKNLRRFEREYHNHTPIWWYTCDCFLYRMLNRALRMMDFDILVKIGFFICDLHRHIEKLYSEQFDVHHHKQSSFIAYRGQGMSKAEFEKLAKTKGGLISFNSFLSVQQVRDVSLEFVRHASVNPDLVGILFQITINPSIPSTPFAYISDVSYFKSEEEILFSMHSVFRIGEIQPIDNHNHLYQVNLTLTSDEDPDLRVLTKAIQEEIVGPTGWHRLGNLLLKLGQFNNAQQLYEVLLEQTTDNRQKSLLYNQFGLVKNGQGDYADALAFYEKSLKIRQQILSPNHLDLAQSFNNIGVTYAKLGDYSKALSSQEKALEIRQKALPHKHPDLALSYSNIGLIYDKMGEYSKALSYHEKALEIRQTILPPNHADFAESYNNIGLVYYDMGEYSKALSYHEKALEIREKSLPSNHPDLAESYNNIGLVYNKMKAYSKALSFCERAVAIGQYSLSANHPNLELWKKTLELVKKNCK